jgi:tartrate-resistant acid phosphatase type 5
MDNWEQAKVRGGWSRRRFLQQTAKFSALALLRSPLAVGEMAFTGTPPDARSSQLFMLGDWGTVTDQGSNSQSRMR